MAEHKSLLEMFKSYKAGPFHFSGCDHISGDGRLHCSCGGLKRHKALESQIEQRIEKLMKRERRDG